MNMRWLQPQSPMHKQLNTTPTNNQQQRVRATAAVAHCWHCFKHAAAAAALDEPELGVEPLNVCTQYVAVATAAMQAGVPMIFAKRCGAPVLLLLAAHRVSHCCCCLAHIRPRGTSVWGHHRCACACLGVSRAVGLASCSRQEKMYSTGCVGYQVHCVCAW